MRAKRNGSAPDLEVDRPEYSEVMRNRRSVAENQSLRREIAFDNVKGARPDGAKGTHPFVNG
jgi:hypothetical protein